MEYTVNHYPEKHRCEVVADGMSAYVEYRLRGEALAPACVEDVRGALNYVLNHAQGWNIDVNKVIWRATG